MNAIKGVKKEIRIILLYILYMDGWIVVYLTIYTLIIYLTNTILTIDKIQNFYLIVFMEIYI